MTRIYLKRLSIEDGIEIYNMLQRIGKNENEFKNSAHGLSFEQFQDWLEEQDDWSKGKNMPRGYVPQTIFWLMLGKEPIGIGKIRHSLTEQSREIGGNIGYAIDPLQRGKDYATILLKLLIDEANKMNISEKLLTVEKYNPASKRVIEKCGGRIIKESSERWFFEFE